MATEDEPEEPRYRFPTPDGLKAVAEALADFVESTGPNLPPRYPLAVLADARHLGWEHNLGMLSIRSIRRLIRAMIEHGCGWDFLGLVSPVPGAGWFYDTVAAFDLLREVIDPIAARWRVGEFEQNALIYWEGQIPTGACSHSVPFPPTVEPAEHADLAWCARTLAASLIRGEEANGEDSVRFDRPERKTPPVVDLERSTVDWGGVRYNVDDQCAAVADALSRADGGMVTFKDMQSRYPILEAGTHPGSRTASANSCRSMAARARATGSTCKRKWFYGLSN